MSSKRTWLCLCTGWLLSCLLACDSTPRPGPHTEPSLRDAEIRQDASSDPDGDGGVPADAAAPAFDAEVPRPLPTRSTVEHCKLTGTRSEDLPRIELEPLAGPLFDQAISITTRASEPEVAYVIEQSGRVQRVDLSSEPYSVRTVLDLSGRAGCCEQDGLRSAAFDPDFESNGLLFVHYVTGSAMGVLRRSVIARFAVDAGSGQAALASERIVLEVEHPGEGRSGGPLLFDASGMLLIALGDGGADPLAGAPRTSLLGAILRIDPSTGDAAGRYQVPDDNPFAGSTDADDPAPEVFAYGFADPSGCYIDPEDQQLWCTDRGQSYSELNAVRAGRDHGWPEVDGPVCAGTQSLCLNTGSVASMASYAHFEQQCGVLGGMSLTEPAMLRGAIAYADACSGDIRGLGVRGEHDRKRSALGSAAGAITALGIGPDGALLVVDIEGRLSRAGLTADGVPGTFPELLSETGCFEGALLGTPAADLIAFDVRSPLWSDGTHKRRFMVIPSGAQIEAPDDGPWTFPVGTILVKEFALQLDDEDPDSVRPIETRFMLLRPEGWEFHSYRWNDAGSDAQRVQESMQVDFEVRRSGEARSQRYEFPAKDTCPICHSAAPGRPLGPRTDQLNSDLLYRSGSEIAARNQLEVLAELELFAPVEGSSLSQSSAELSQLPQLPDPGDPSVPIEQRARSYLHSNCAHCHQPGGWSSPDLTMDLRYELSLQEARICDEAPAFFPDAPKLIAPGDPQRSAIWVRAFATDLSRMPPVATTEVDPQGISILTAWIENLRTCPPPSD